MDDNIALKFIPGTILELEKMDGALGMEFLNKVFYITDGIMLAQIREITGIDGTTLQNWVKRGWVGNPKNKTYDKNQLARIMIINMMRDNMQLSRVAYLMSYISGSDDCNCIVSESELYDYICRILEKLASPSSDGMTGLDRIIDQTLSEYDEKIMGSRRRLSQAIRVIVMTYYSVIIKAAAERILDSLGADTNRKR